MSGRSRSSGENSGSLFCFREDAEGFDPRRRAVRQQRAVEHLYLDVAELVVTELDGAVFVVDGVADCEALRVVRVGHAGVETKVATRAGRKRSRQDVVQ